MKLALMRFSALRALFGRATEPAAAASEDIYARLLRDRTIFLGLPINDAVADDVITRLLFLERESSRTPIHFFINSPGGLVLAGLAILDTMEKVRAPIVTRCLGTAHSMAAVILAYGCAGVRSANANSIITFSLPKVRDDGDEQKRKDAIRLGEILIAKTAQAAKRPVDEIRKLFREETPLSAEEAVASGIIDHAVRTGS